MGGTLALTGAALLATAILVTATVFSFTALAGGTGADLGGADTGPNCLTMPGSPDALRAGLSVEQASNAAIIVTAGQRMRVPSSGWVIAIATGLRASGLINRTAAAEDGTLGLFDQRPAQGWGTVDEIADPPHAAGAFYEALLRIDGWQAMAVAEASRTVRQSAGTDERFVAQARSMVAAFTGGNAGNDPACGQVTISATGWTRPVPGEVISGFRTRELPKHQGIDFAAARYTIIRAASAGTVVTAVCNIAGRFYPVAHTPSPCDTDGSPDIGGCGWYLEIQHSGDIVSRYCHLVRAPEVAIGQTVSAGQPIGLAGTSGHSSATHLHFEIHKGYPAEPHNATEPTAFLADQGVVLDH
ncbi:MAG: M23 family metallopeptidase [Dactylosporangium sp.]|nr:M23 family metallopeptidase [Dactylosporangium sp.]NNJ63851.1 M23 family metallopeptidase [Dactylosporangium sp.]